MSITSKTNLGCSGNIQGSLIGNQRLGSSPLRMIFKLHTRELEAADGRLTKCGYVKEFGQRLSGLKSLPHSANSRDPNGDQWVG